MSVGVIEYCTEEGGSGYITDEASPWLSTFDITQESPVLDQTTAWLRDSPPGSFTFYQRFGPPYKEPPTGLEPATSSLRMKRSAIELGRHSTRTFSILHILYLAIIEQPTQRGVGKRSSVSIIINTHERQRIAAFSFPISGFLQFGICSRFIRFLFNFSTRWTSRNAEINRRCSAQSILAAPSNSTILAHSRVYPNPAGAGGDGTEVSAGAGIRAEDGMSGLNAVGTTSQNPSNTAYTTAMALYAGAALALLALPGAAKILALPLAFLGYQQQQAGNTICSQSGGMGC